MFQSESILSPKWSGAAEGMGLGRYRGGSTLLKYAELVDGTH